MSEFIESRRGNSFIRNRLLSTVSALALSGYVSLAPAGAEDADRPIVWIELGGQLEAMQDSSSPFIAPFMSAISPAPKPYADDIFTRTQKPANLGLGLEGAATFQPADSDWILSASLRYGRSQTSHHIHHQSPPATFQYTNFTKQFQAAAFADSKESFDESHAILDFMVGKDVGLGEFGRDGTSIISLGVRFAQFSNKSKVTASGRPEINVGKAGNRYEYTFYNYTMFADAARSFHGIGPTLSWNASADLLGNKNAGELTFDWGINGAVLFGRQKAKTSHTTQAYHLPITQAYNGLYDAYYYTRVPQKSHHNSRVSSRSVVVPNIGGFVGISVKYTNVKASLGYRADLFFGAMDGGVDAAKKDNAGFYGPFATVSIGIGG
jgi:iron complex outermembrane receptor protein